MEDSGYIGLNLVSTYLFRVCVCVCVNHTTVASGFHSVDLLLNMAILCDKLAEWNHLPEKVSFH